jgi:PAS domain S-box-containing protein
MVGSMLDDPKILKKIVEHNLDIITIIDVKGNILYESPAVERVLGYKPGELAGKSVFDQIHEKDLHKGSRLLKQALLNPSHEVRSELRYRHKNGHWILLEFVGRPIFEKGMLGTIIISSRDISEKADAEARLKESAERYKSFFESSGFGMIVIDTKGKLLDINMTLVSLMGYHRKNELIGKSIWEFHSKENVKQGKKCLSQTLIKGKHFFEIPLLKKNGSVFIAEVNLSTFFEKGETFVQGVVKDITEERHAGARLRESEEQYRLLAENSADIIWTMDRKLNFTYLSPSLNNVLGFSPEEWIGTSLASHFSSVKKFAAASKHALDAMRRPKGFIDVLFETSMPHKNGKEIPVEIHGTLLKDVKGKIIGVQGTTREISERKKNEQELKKSEKRLSDIILTSADFIWEVNSKGEYTYVSETVKSILGYSEKEMLGKTPFDFMTEEEAKRVGATFKKIIKKREKIVDLENWNLDKNGRRVCFLTNGIPIYDGKQWIGYRGVDKDITDRKYVEQELSFLSSLVKRVSDAIIVTDTKFMITYVNPAAEKLFGYTTDELVGKNLTLFNIEENAEENDRKLFEKLKKGESVYSESLNRRKNGSTFICGYNISPLKDERGKIYGYVGVERDITEKKKTEQELRLVRERFTRIFESSNDGYVILGLDNTILDCNKAYAKLLKYSKEELVGKSFYSLTPKKRHTWQKKNVWKERLLKTGYSGVYQKEYIRKDGVVIPVELEAYCIFEGKKPQYLWAVVQDISEWKHIEEQIEKVNDIINQSPMVAIRWRNSEGWPVEQVSKNVKELFGYTVDEFTSERFAFGKVIHPDDVERVAQEVEAISRKKGTKRFSQRYRIIRKDGTERTIEDVTLIVKKKGKITHYEGIIWDVTESERSHKEREESEKALKTIFETTSEGIMMTDANSGKLTYVNPAAALMLGYEKDDLLGRVHNVVHPKGAKHPLSAVCGGSGKGDDAVSISIPFIRKDRNVIYCDIATSLMKIGGKELIVNFIRDITERRNRENEMAKHVADLERFNAMVINRELKMIELKKRVQELEEALEKKE